ncbi:hypothetical protein POV27_14120 [Aureisphaera galaxeae]|uniref:hypothetical protein n=1 Tax=Aureisphaera galaxeae TaxID=1538023 RepID=UPI002350E73D|nr:hypothetical protein [Aureisphaera galaxeae]MDC8005193.1 hypothetical protein [Aureisphaera galaxeae]
MRTIVKMFSLALCFALLAFTNEGKEVVTGENEAGKRHKELIVKSLRGQHKGDYSKVSFQEITTKVAMDWMKKNGRKKCNAVNKSNKNVLKKISKKGQLKGYLIKGISKGKITEALLVYNQTGFQIEKADFSYWVVTNGDAMAYGDDDDDDDDEEPEECPTTSETSMYGYAADYTTSAPFPPEDYGSGGACPCMAESVPDGEGGGNCAEQC